MARRGHGEDSVYMREDGRWAASITLEGRKRKTLYGKNRKEVQEKLREVIHEQMQGTLSTGHQQTLKQYLELWLEIHKAALRLTTYVRYRSAIYKHILPSLGHV